MSGLAEAGVCRWQVRSPGGEWQEVALSKSIKALVVLNLQSYAGGRDLWGLKDSNKDAAKGWKVPIFNDGLIEVRVTACTSDNPYVHYIAPWQMPLKEQ